MNISKRQKNQPLLRRLLLAFRSVPERDRVCSGDTFQRELAKEISRSNRRQSNRDFALVHFSVLGSNEPLHVTEAMAESFLCRMRISDTLGWHGASLALLLPETDRDGANLVTNDLVQLGIEHGVQLDSTVYVYPWDDDLISVANEIARSNDQPRPRDDKQGGGGLADKFQQTDLAHRSEGDQVDGAFVKRPNFIDNEQIGLVDRGETAGGAARKLGTSEVALLESSGARNGWAASAAASAQVAAPSMPGNQVQLACDKELRIPIRRSTEMVRPVATPVWKRTIDILGAGAGLVVLSPVLAAAAVAIKVTSPGPVLFRQKREGKDGKPFEILKFRTMVVGAEAKQDSLRKVSEQDGPAFKLKDDPRITLVGKTLRKSCVDELPQLVNVLVGQMSLVGPRPLPVSESTKCAPWQRMRLTVAPGLTCTWQARGGRQVSFEQWMRMDLDYIENRSFVNDLRLIFETALIALMQRGSV